VADAWLRRFGSMPMGTFGTLHVGDQSWFTVERPWLYNKPSVSCIPAGRYPLTLGFFYSGDGVGGKPDYPAYELQGVPGRTLIKIHRANRASQVEGCIAVGKLLGSEAGQWAVLQSAIAYAEWMQAAAEAKVDALVVQWAPVEPTEEP
jgi:hypothetical protein